MISPAQPADGPALLELARRCNLTRPLQPGYLEKFWQMAADQGAQASGYHFLITRNDHGLAACACYGPRPLTEGAYDLYCLAGDDLPIMNVLLAEVIRAVQARQGRLILAESSSLPAFAPVHQLFASAGFETEITIPDFYHPGDDLVIFTRHLDGSNPPPPKSERTYDQPA